MTVNVQGDIARRIEALSKAAHDIIWWADPVQGFCEPQEAWAAYTGQTFEEYRNWGHVAAIHPDDRERVQKAWMQATEEKRECNCEYRVYCPDQGEYRHCMARGVPVLGEDGEIVEWVGVLSDVHDLKAAQAELARANLELESRIAARTAELTATVEELERFTYTISHDLRQALRGIAINVHLLEDLDGLPQPHASRLHRIQHNAQQLNQILEDLLELGRLGRQEIRAVSNDFSRLTTEVADWLYRRYPDHFGSVHVQPGLSITADPRMLRRLCEELLDNALKFSPPPAKVQVGALEDGQTFFVRDEGSGFDPRYCRKIFEPFERLQRGDSTPGTGIGLAKVQRIVRRHGGRVWAESTPGHGATLYFALNPILL